jgi:hypothetical protein
VQRGFLAVVAIAGGGRGERNPGFGNRGFHIQDNSLPI